ncbi:MAG: hypothetical protein IKW49_08705 [Opitutales bacterium]|nr:hypothetical protein [Opitutales bacterium]
MAVYKLEKSEYGECRDKAGVRYTLNECGVAITPQGVNYGYTEFPSRADALAHYGVEDIPESELFGTEG